MRILILLLAMFAPSVFAATVTVTNLNDSGAGSLREAVSNANSGDEIFFDSSLAGGTLTLTSGEIAIGAKVLTITGLTASNGKPSLTISGNDASRIFSTSEALTLHDLRLLDGNSGVVTGGAIYNSNSTIDCRNCVFESNRTTGANGGALSGDVTTLIDCSFIDNSTPSSWVGGAILAFGASNKNYLRCTFSGNMAGAGGAISLEGSSSSINKAINCTFSSNHATSTTFRGGGAITIDASSGSSVSLTAVHSTFSENTCARASGGQCVWIRADSLTNPSWASFYTETSIFVDSSADAMFAVGGGGGNENYTSSGYNVCGDAPSWMTASFDQTNTAPLLAVLADNGGLTMTHAITAASPAYDAGAAFTAVTTDQRGYTRDSNPDAGSFEVGATAPGSGSTSGSGGGGGDDDESCSTSSSGSWLWLALLGSLAVLAVARRLHMA